MAREPEMDVEDDLAAPRKYQTFEVAPIHRVLMVQIAGVSSVGDRVQGYVREVRERTSYQDSFVGSDYALRKLRLSLKDLDRLTRKEIKPGKVLTELEVALVRKEYYVVPMTVATNISDESESAPELLRSQDVDATTDSAASAPVIEPEPVTMEAMTNAMHSQDSSATIGLAASAPATDPESCVVESRALDSNADPASVAASVEAEASVATASSADASAISEWGSGQWLKSVIQELRGSDGDDGEYVASALIYKGLLKLGEDIEMIQANHAKHYIVKGHADADTPEHSRDYMLELFSKCNLNRSCNSEPDVVTSERLGDAEERIALPLAMDESRSDHATTAASDVALAVENQQLVPVDDLRSQDRRAGRSAEPTRGPPADAASAQGRAASPWDDMAGSQSETQTKCPWKTWRTSGGHSGWSDFSQGKRWSARPGRGRGWYPSAYERADAAGI